MYCVRESTFFISRVVDPLLANFPLSIISYENISCSKCNSDVGGVMSLIMHRHQYYVCVQYFKLIAYMEVTKS